MKTLIMKHKLVLNVFLFLSIIIILWLYFLEKYRIQVFFDLNADSVNKLAENLSLAYIASYIFYFVVVVLKEKEDKKIILPFVADYTYVLMNNAILFSVASKSEGNQVVGQYETGIHGRSNNIYPS